MSENEVLKELFESRKRCLVDEELRRVITEYADCETLSSDLLYHLRLDSECPEATLGHSKRLRAYLCLLFAEERGIDLEIALPCAVTVELIHNATLIVDDVQDEDAFRCGRPALWKKTSIPEAMNSAFFLACMSQAYYHAKVGELGLFDHTEEIVTYLNALISGQQRDLTFDRLPERGIQAYEKMVDGKTGALISLSCLMGCCVRKDIDAKERNSVRSFAIDLSRVHQIQDDLDDLLSLFADRPESISIPRGNIAAYYLSVETSSRSVRSEDIVRVLEFASSYLDTLRNNLQQGMDDLLQKRIICSSKLHDLVSVLSCRNNQQLEAFA